MVRRKIQTDKSEAKPRWAYSVCITSGIVLTLVMIGVALFLQHPTILQMFVFRVVMALAAAGFGASIPGFLRLRIPLWERGVLHAGGALGLFVLIYLINPPALVSTPPEEVPETLLTVVDETGNPLDFAPGDICPLKRELLGGDVAAVEINPVVFDKISKTGLQEGDYVTVINDLNPPKWMKGRIFILNLSCARVTSCRVNTVLLQ